MNAFCAGVNSNLDQNESDIIRDSEDLNDQTEAMVNPAENTLEKRMPEDKEEHASERTPRGRECPILKRKLMGKVEKAMTKGNKREEREIEEEFKALQVNNKLALDEENKGE